jgi:hypothetical protein
MPHSVVKSNVANYEAKNHQLRSVSTPTSSIISEHSHPAVSVASHDDYFDDVDATSTSVAASESRKSRIRQQFNTHKSHHPTNLMEKRKQIKERRSMLQQKRAQEQNPSDDHSSSGRGVTLARKTGYPATEPEKETPVVTPTVTATEDSYNTRRAEQSSKVTSSDSSPLRKSTGNRMSKIQRMQQRMRGYDHVKRGSAGTPSAAPSVIQSTASTAVARNHTEQPQNEQSSQPRQHHYEFQQSGPQHTGQFSPSPPPSPGSKHRIPIDSSGVALSPSVRHDHSFTNLNNHTSPRSGTDVFSESQYIADASVDPVTDDDATLTSVRRIMENTNNRNQQQHSPSNHSHQQYQSLQAHRKQRGSNDYHNPIHVGGNNNNNAFSSNGSYSHNRLQQEYRNGHEVHRRRDWLDEEKSEKAHHRGGVFRTASSSDYDTDGDISKTSNRSNTLEGPSQSQATDVNDFFAARSRYTQPNPRRTEDDDRTFDYGDRDDESNGSASYAARKLKEAQRRALREQEGKEQHTPATPTSPITESPLINKDDVEHYKKSMDTPAMKVGAGFVGIATVGFFVFGPAGLLVGAAAAGISAGVMKIPEEKRNDMQERATKAMNEFHEKALDASENMSSSCANTYKDSGVAEHFPQCFDLGSDTAENDHESMTQSEKVRGGKKGNQEGGVGGVTKSGMKHPSTPSKLEEGSPVLSPNNQTSNRMRNKKVACLRNGKYCICQRILPVELDALFLTL